MDEQLQEVLAALPPENANIVQLAFQAAAAQGQAQAAAAHQVMIDERDQRKQIKALLKIVNRFSGKGIDVEDYLIEVELDFEIVGIESDAVKSRALLHLLMGGAKTWAMGLFRNNNWPMHYEDLEDGDEVVPGARTLLLREYRPVDPQEKYRNLLDNLKQTGSAHAYTQRFRELSSKIHQTPEDAIHRYIDGLQAEVQNHVRLGRVLNQNMTLEQIIFLATKFDEELYRQRFRKSRSVSSNNKRHQDPPPPPRQYSGVAHRTAAASHAVVPMDVDSIQAAPSANAVHPKMTNELRFQLIRDGKCFYCKQPGHRALHCPLKKRRLHPNVHRQ